jgi:hypothetical protein
MRRPTKAARTQHNSEVNLLGNHAAHNQ